MELKTYNNKDSRLKTQDSRRGFSILETFIAMMVLSLVILGALSLVTFSLRSVSISKHRTIAFFLAAEPIEYIRNWRDNNFINNPGVWLDGFNFCRPDVAPSKDYCEVDVNFGYGNAQAFKSCHPINGCDPIRLDDNIMSSTYGSYGYDNGWTETIFTRSVVIEEDLDNSDEKKIKVIVSWEERFGQTKTVTLENRIYNWR